MYKDEQHADVSGDALQGVPPVVLIAVTIDVGPPGAGEVNPQQSVVGDRQPQQADLDQDQPGQAVDKVYLVLKGFDARMGGNAQTFQLPSRQLRLVEQLPPHNRRVRRQMRKQIHADWEHTR